MSERPCVAKKKDLELGPHTEVTIECGLTNHEHLNTHMTRQRVEDVTVNFMWPGSFEPAKGEEGGDV